MSNRAPSPVAMGLSAFAGTMMILVGFFQAIAGFSALLNSDIYVVGKEYVFRYDATTWGWIHLLIGILLVLAGLGVLRGSIVGRTVAVVIVAISAITNFLFLLGWNQPFWSLLLIALDVAIIWALTVRGTDIAKM